MNEEQLQLLYDSYANKQGFKDYGEFKSLMGNDSSRKEFFNSSNKTLGFKDYNEFNSLLKKKDNLESSGVTPQEVSTTPITPRKSLLDTENQKKQLAWDTSVGKSKDVTLGGFKINKPIVGATKAKTQKLSSIPSVDFNKMNVDQLIDLDKGNEVTYQAPTLAAMGGGVSKTKMSPELRPQFDNFIKENYSTAIQKIKPYVLKKEDLNSIEDDYKEAQSGGSWLDKAGAYAKSFLSNISMEEDEAGDRNKVKKPLDDLRKEVRDEAIHNGETLLPGQVEYRVKQKFIEKRTKEVNQTKMNSAKENLTPAEQYSYGLHKAEQASHLSKENKEKTKNYYETLSNSKSLLDDKKQLVDEYNEMKANKTPIPQDYIDRYKDNEQNIALNLGLAKAYKTEINKNQGDIGTFEQEAAAYTSENNEMLDITKRIQSYGYGFMGGVHEFAAKYIDKPLAKFAEENLATPIDYIAGLEKADISYSEEYAKKAQDIKEGKEGVVKGVRLGGTTKTLSVNNINDAANELVSVVGDNVGMTAMLLAGGEVGLAATTIESTSAKVKEIRNENEEFKAVRDEALKNKEGSFEFNGEKYNTKEYANKDLHSEVASYLVPAAWGATMILPMAGQLKFLQNEARIAAAIERESPDLLQKTLMQKSKDWTKQYIGHSLGLARDLKVMSLAQAGLDNALGKKVDYFKVAADLKGFRDAFILHGMNAGFAHVLGQTARPYMTNEEAKTIDENARLISYLNNRLKSEELTPESKGLVKKQLDRLTAESKVHIDNTIDRMSNMSDADYSKVIDLAKKSSDLRQEATDTQNSNLMDIEKQKALDKIKVDYLENEKNLRGVKENYTPKKDGFFALPEREQNKLKDEAGKKLIAEAKERGEKEFAFSDRDITMEASKLYDFKNIPKEEEEVVTPTEETPKKEEESVTPKEEVTPKEKEVVNPTEEVKTTEPKVDYKLPENSDVDTMSVVENDGKFLIGNYTEKTETSNPVLKPVSDLENNPLSFNSKEEAQAKLDEIKSPVMEEIKPTETKAPEVEAKPEPKTRSTRKTKPIEETPPKVEEVKEIVSLPEDLIKKITQHLIDSKTKGFEEKPCEIG